MSEFQQMLSQLEAMAKNASAKAWSKLDKVTYAMLINCLKGEDAESVRDALVQLSKEGKESAIPPVYLVSEAHPNPWVKEQAKKALANMADVQQIKELAAGKDLKSAMQALINRYGNFRC